MNQKHRSNNPFPGLRSFTPEEDHLFFGAAPRAWVDIKLRELLKAAGSGRSGPIQPQAVYVAPPEDHRKERFRSLQARVIRQGAEFKPDAELEVFIAELKEVHP